MTQSSQQNLSGVTVGGHGLIQQGEQFNIYYTIIVAGTLQISFSPKFVLAECLLVNIHAYHIILLATTLILTVI